uniref:Uncharacterized protein n=1 Tax=Rhipicephalus zambeziensis TaxID=60191 RepID=A0A224YFW3_9ACAR
MTFFRRTRRLVLKHQLTSYIVICIKISFGLHLFLCVCLCVQYILHMHVLAPFVFSPSVVWEDYWHHVPLKLLDIHGEAGLLFWKVPPSALMSVCSILSQFAAKMRSHI